MSSLPVCLPTSLPVPLSVGPGADEARSSLRRELLRPDYNEEDLLGRALDWVARLINGLIDATADAPGSSTLVAMVVLVALVLALVLLLSRVRRTARARAGSRAVLTGEAVTAAELRTRAEAALAAGRHEEAVVEGFRALALRQVERGRLEDSPGATAHEVARSLATEYPHRAEVVDAGAVLFEQVLYGDRPADAGQARSVLQLDDDLAVSQ